jgi:hypothetical protein
MTTTAIAHLASLISTGDLTVARQWAHENRNALASLRSNADDQATIAHACNRWGAPIVWPFGDTQAPLAAQLRVLVAMRAGRAWRANEDTIAVIVAAGWARFDDSVGAWRVAA